MPIGRAREIGALTALLARAAEGAGGVALLLGEAGIGKTHLLAALAEEAARRGFDTAVGRAFADAGRDAFAPWREALGEGAFAAAGVSLGGLGDRARSFERPLAAVRTRAEARPLLVAIEDLHWADDESLLLFRHVARFGVAGPVLLVGTVRDPDLDAGRHAVLEEVLADLVRHPACERLTLRPLAEPEVAEAAGALAGGTVPQALAQALAAETGGNPLYLRELVRHMLEDGKLVLRDGRLGSDFAATALGLPPSIRHVVRQRVARLTPRTAALLRVAAVAASPLPLATLAAAAGLAEDDALDALDEAVAAGVIRSAGARTELSHAIVGRAIAEEIGPDRRLRLHRRLAEALATTVPDAHAEIAAHHRASSAVPGAEAGVPHALAAAEIARAAGSHLRAAQLLALAAELAGPDTPRTDIECRLAVALAEALDGPAAVAAAERAIDGLAGQDDRIAELVTACVRALEAGGVPRAVWQPLLARCLAATAGRRDLAWARLVLLDRSPVPVVAGPAWISRLPPPDRTSVGMLRAHGTASDLAATVDPHDDRSPAETQDLLLRVRRGVEPAAAIRILDACGRDLFFRATDLRAAGDVAHELRALSRRVGALAGEASACMLLTCIEASLGAFAVARDTLAAGSAIAARLGALHRMNVVGPTAAGAVLGHFVGTDWQAAAARLVGFATAPQAGATPYGLVALNLGIVALAESGDADGARPLVPALVAALEALPPGLNEWGAGRDCGVTAAWLLGRPDKRLQALAAWQPAEAGSACWSCAAQSGARMAALAGDLDAARRGLDAARAVFAASGRAPSLAICDHDEALAFRRCGRPAGAEGALDRAEAAFRTLGMAPWIERVQRLREAATPDGLTPREIEVLRLVAGGLPNKRIATTLGISVPTVERHVANIYEKTGCRGRADAATYALRRGLVPG